LLEPQRTNYAAISEYFDHIDWAKSGLPSVVVNSERSPELLQNACTLTSTASGDRIQLSRQNLTGDVTYSAYVKSNGAYTKFRMRDSGSGNDARFHIDANGTITYDTGTNNGYTIKEHGDGWYRLSFTFTGAAGTSLMQLFPDFTNGGGSVYVYGAQMEQGSYATSYIPTYGSAVTRNVDLCNKTSATSIIGQTEGTIFIEGKINADNTDDYNRIFGISQGNDSYRIIIFSSNQEELSMNVKNAGNTEASITSTISPLSTFKAAIGYAANDFVFYVNGQQIGTDNSGSVPACHTISLGTHEDGSGTRVIEGGVNQALLFKTRLTNAELADLTTL
jgi:hypothetical protein